MFTALLKPRKHLFVTLRHAFAFKYRRLVTFAISSLANFRRNNGQIVARQTDLRVSWNAGRPCPSSILQPATIVLEVLCNERNSGVMSPPLHKWPGGQPSSRNNVLAHHSYDPLTTALILMRREQASGGGERESEDRLHWEVLGDAHFVNRAVARANRCGASGSDPRNRDGSVISSSISRSRPSRSTPSTRA